MHHKSLHRPIGHAPILPKLSTSTCKTLPAKRLPQVRSLQRFVRQPSPFPSYRGQREVHREHVLLRPRRVVQILLRQPRLEMSPKRSMHLERHSVPYRCHDVDQRQRGVRDVERVHGSHVADYRGALQQQHEGIEGRLEHHLDEKESAQEAE